MRRTTVLIWLRAAALCIASLLILAQQAVANPAVFEPATDPGIGFNLIAWSGNSGTNWSGAIDSMYAAGFREVSISPVRRLDGATGNITAGSYPPLTAVDAGVARAKQLGMRVTLNPFVELSSGARAANFAPLPGSTVANTFWPQYESYLDEVATIAQNRGVDAMNVGTEMKGLDSFYTITDFDPSTPGTQGVTQAQLDQQKANWTTVISSAASIYTTGQLGYASNWDNYNASRVTNNLWSNSDIDYIGIDSYFTGIVSTSVADASGTYPNSTFINSMANGWANKLDGGTTGILDFAAGIGKPVVFTEAGYLPCNRTGNNPQGSCDSQGDCDIDEFDTGVDSDEQIMAFYGMIRALDGKQANVRAMHIWQWWMSGSSGSLWNIDPPPEPTFDDNPTHPTNYDQPANVAFGKWLSGFVSNLLPGDFNRNGVVDGADYVVWRKTQGQTVCYFSAADGDGSGVVDSSDYAVWRANFGAPAGGGASLAGAVPEPAAAWLLLAGIVCGVFRHRLRGAG